MDLETQRVEEREVLASIYGGDGSFHALDDDSTFQFRVEPEDNPLHPKRFMLQLKWPETYPEAIPEISLDIFYNNHLSSHVKREMSAKITEEANLWTGSAMTYTLFEFVREKYDTLVPDEAVEAQQQDADSYCEEEKVPLPTKATKIEQVDESSSKPRGWNWVDVLKHLAQMGPQPKEKESAS